MNSQDVGRLVFFQYSAVSTRHNISRYVMLTGGKRLKIEVFDDRTPPPPDLFHNSILDLVIFWCSNVL